MGENEIAHVINSHTDLLRRVFSIDSTVSVLRTNAQMVVRVCWPVYRTVVVVAGPVTCSDSWRADPCPAFRPELVAVLTGA